jgi:hypothetical protein
MPAASSAQLTEAIPFPDEIGEPVWRETRSFPVMTVGGPVVALLVIGAIGVRLLALHVLLGAAAIVTLWLLVRAREGAVIETYTVSERFVAVEQRRGGRVAIPTERLTGVTIAGDRVRLEARDGVVTLGFVSRRRALLRALERVAPGLQFDREIDPLCPT